MKRCNIALGRFQPFTKGHLQMLRDGYDKNGLPAVVFMISNKKYDSKHPFSDNLIKRELEIIKRNNSFIMDIISADNADIVKIGQELHRRGYEAQLWLCGGDREAGFKRQAENPKYRELGHFPDTFTTYTGTGRSEGVSGTAVRDALRIGDKEAFTKLVPAGVAGMFSEFKEAIAAVKESLSMVSLVDYIKESLTPKNIHEMASFKSDDWQHRGAYDYAERVINDLLQGKDIPLGRDGEGKNGIKKLSLSDFDADKLRNLLNNISDSPETVQKFNDAIINDEIRKAFRNNVWIHIWKSPYSNIYTSKKEYNIFEHKLAYNLQSLVVNGKLDTDAPYEGVTMSLWNKISGKPAIQKLQKMNLNMETVKDYVFVSGTGATSRNRYNQIINNDTFEVNMTKRCQLTDSTETKIENVLTQSGKIIADITITTEGKQFNKSNINAVNKDDIYISCKNKHAQLTGITIQQPFYGNYNKKSTKSYIIDCYHNGKSYEEFMSKSDDICVISFSNLCSLFGIDGKTVYDYFSVPSSQRSTNQKIKTSRKTEENDDVIAVLIQLLVGGNYWYVNSDGTVAYIDDDIDKNMFTFIPSGYGELTPKMIKIMGTMKTKYGQTQCKLVFRSAYGEEYPYRLFPEIKDKHAVMELFA